jgi:hypothetical protein
LRHRSTPVAASSATIARPGVGAKSNPSTTIGVHWMFAAPSPARKIHATCRSRTFSRVICRSAEYRRAPLSPCDRVQRLNCSAATAAAGVSSSGRAAGMY